MSPTLFVNGSSEDCRRILRRMELETYGTVVSTLRAQGELNKDRRKLLQDLAALLAISPERHKAEVRRAVNDDKLALISLRVSGGVDTEWEWALEGRRVVPLMPRLLHPTPLTSLATAVSKAINLNPKICASQPPAEEEAPLKYVRDPDDEDTLSPVMVPVASPDSSCHSNNNIDLEEPCSNSTLLCSSEVAPRKPEPIKRLANPANIPPLATKRPRSPVSQQANVLSAPLPKVRAVSPSSNIWPQQRIPPGQPAPTCRMIPQNSRPLSTPTSTVHNAHTPGKIRVRTPSLVPSTPTGLRPMLRPTTPQSIQTTRPLLNAAVKQVVQIRTTSLQQQQQKEAVRTSTTQSVASVASTIAKSLPPGKANVIVLHKNSPAARNVVTSRDVERGQLVAAKTKTVNAPAKVTFPGNVRIITVPSSAVNNVGANAGVSNHLLPAKVVSSSGVAGSMQKNVFLLELNNEDVAAKTILLTDIMANAMQPEVNGIPVEQSVHPVTQLTTFDGAADGDSTTNRTVVAGSWPRRPSVPTGCPVSTDRVHEKNGNHVSSISTVQCVDAVESGVLDPQTGIFYTSSKDGSACHDPPRMDIFSTALASADISLESSTFSDVATEKPAAGTSLILTDAFDSPKAQS